MADCSSLKPLKVHSTFMTIVVLALAGVLIFVIVLIFRPNNLYYLRCLATFLEIFKSVFIFSLNFDGKLFQMNVKRIYEGDTIERFGVSAGGKSVILQTNYHHLKKINSRRNPDWKIISGEVKNGVSFALTVRQIELHFQNEER